MRRFILTAALFLFGAAGVVFAYAPYLPQIVMEGYPPLTWPAAGHFATIEGAAQPMPLEAAAEAAQRRLPTRLDADFTESGGKALLVYRAGKLELEHYGDAISAETRLNSYSMAKSLVGALIFKAIAEGRIRNLDATLAEVIPQHSNPVVAQISLLNLLRMRSGILAHSPLFGGEDGTKFIEDTTLNPFGPKAHLHFVGLNSIRSDLTLGPGATPEFAYQNVNTALLGLVLETLYQRPLSELLAQQIWRPAGAHTGYWRQVREGGEISAYCCIYATPRDWIRIGYFLMRNGTPGQPFLPEPLWREFMGQDLDAGALRQGVYGHHIRHDLLDRSGESLQGAFTYLLGQGGQTLYLMPQHDLVVFRSGERAQRLHSTLYAAWNAVQR